VNPLNLLILLLFLNIPITNATSPPPWLATVEAEIEFPQTSSCPEIANIVLKQDGFEKVSQQNNALFAAWKEGKHYHHKVLVKCLPRYHLITITVVSMKSGGLQKAKELLEKIRAIATGTSEESPLPGHSPDEIEEIPDCSDGVALVRCLSSVPDDSLEIVQDYLDKIKAKHKKKP
jgi:hypothetical protein